MKRCVASRNSPRESGGGAQVTSIGALRRAKLAYFNWEAKARHAIQVSDQVEVASLVGDIAVGPDGRPSIHVHAVLGRRDRSAMAGHLEEAHVRPTLEIIVTESPAIFVRRRTRRATSPSSNSEATTCCRHAPSGRAGCARIVGVGLLRRIWVLLRTGLLLGLLLGLPRVHQLCHPGFLHRYIKASASRR
jgi:predicted DNA-binding protein with PD1-like motif